MLAKTAITCLDNTKENSSSICFLRDGAGVSLRAWIRRGPVTGISMLHPCNAHSGWSDTALSRGLNQGTYRCPFQTRLSPAFVIISFCPCKAKSRWWICFILLNLFISCCPVNSEINTPTQLCHWRDSQRQFSWVCLLASRFLEPHYQPFVFRCWIAH